MPSRFSTNEVDKRVILVNGQQLYSFPSNRISTTKYSIITFIPIFLYEQFRNFTNIFFVMIILMQQIPGASPVGMYTSLIPLIVIFGISAVRELMEDLKRYQLSKYINEQQVHILIADKWIKIKWEEVNVGNIIKVNNNEYFPADILLIRSNNTDGVCYIETANLDGETNLKIRKAVPQLSHLATTNDFASLVATIECDLPSDSIYTFTGTMEIDDKFSLHPEQLLLRGSKLCNTAWIVGIVIYSGHETKIMKNANATPLKQSSITQTVNIQVFIMFIIFVLLVILNVIFYRIYFNQMVRENWYLNSFNDEFNNLLSVTITFCILYSFLIPISLQVSVEAVRCVQVIFINNDLDMYDEESDTRALARTTTLNEDLGKIKYIFTDKTGTLTQNILEFKGCIIHGSVYIEHDLKKLAQYAKKAALSSITFHFFICICLCHGVIPVQDPDTKETVYYTSSPDQYALIKAAKQLGYVLTSRSFNTVTVVIPNKKVLKYKILGELEFTSARKRSSVIVESPDRKIYLYIMGADDEIYKRLSRLSKHTNKTSKTIEAFAITGFRTLCLGMVELTPKIFNNWYKSYKEATISLDQRLAKVEKVAELIEKNIVLLGATAVEDKLQDKVPETLQLLLQAGINIWMLTGDKQETAINVGLSSHLIEEGMPLVTLNSENLSVLNRMIEYYSKKLGNKLGKPGNNLGMVITGASLQSLTNSQYMEKFILLAVSCKSVICCRASPLQKANIVSLVQHKTGYLTLAIGDGANDVAMIQKATIGIGITGGEGMQAAQSADYSIGQFRYLLKLLFVHGTWNYNRICMSIFYCYYKSIAFVMVQLYFSIKSSWSGQILFDRWTIIFYNILFTSGPLFVIGVLEQSDKKYDLLKYPQLYKLNNWFNYTSFLLCLLNGIFHASIITVLCFALLYNDTLWTHGRNANYLVQGNVIYICLVIVVSFKVALHISYWTWCSIFFITTSIISYFIVLLVLSFVYPKLPVGEEMSRMILIIVSSPVIWLTIIVVPILVLLCDFAIISLWRTYNKPKISSKMKSENIHIFPLLNELNEESDHSSHEFLYYEGECAEECTEDLHCSNCGRRNYHGYAYTGFEMGR